MPAAFRVRVKKLLNNPNEVVEEMLDGVVRAHGKFLQPIGGSKRALVARDGPRPGKVGLVIGGGRGMSHASLAMLVRDWQMRLPLATSFRLLRPIRLSNVRLLHPMARACSSSMEIMQAMS